MSSEKLDLDFGDISRKLKQFTFPKVDYVVGIAEGGVYPAILVAHQLGVDCKFIHLSFRDHENHPVYPEPVLLSGDRQALPKGSRILLVDEVSVTGKTMSKALEFLKDFEVTTFVLKGKGDFVLYPEVKTCVNWPWKVN